MQTENEQIEAPMLTLMVDFLHIVEWRLTRTETPSRFFYTGLEWNRRIRGRPHDLMVSLLFGLN